MNPNPPRNLPAVRLVKHPYLMLGVALMLLVAANLFSQRALASVTTSVAPGWDIYTSNNTGYRYGPSILMDAQGIHVYTCSPGANGAWDFIRYMSSTDGGHTWGPESIVLQPTAGSPDAYSTCDPGVIQFGGYYYIGYTSTVDSRGTDNNVFVARSTSRTGPFDKWNGSGWGGNPAPFVTYHGNGPAYDYGAGEPSFVVVNSTLYIYYTWASHDTNGNPILQTRVATASSTDANWPANLTYQGVAIAKRPDQGADSSDVKYIDAYSKFIAVNTSRRFGPKSFIQMWESTDGIHFYPSHMSKDNLLPYLHNDGISGDGQGHINVAQNNFIGYAYGSQWANWNTALNPITFANDNLPAPPDIYSVQPKNGAVRLEFQTNPNATSYTIKYGTQSGNYTASSTGITASPYTLSGLTNGTPYYLVIDAVGASGSSIDSSQVSAMPQNYTPITLVNATSSSQIAGWAPTNVIDSSLATNYSSQGHNSENNTEWISVDAGANTSIARLVVSNRQRDQLAGPNFDNKLDTQIQVSSDANTWFNVDYRLNTYPIIDDDGYAKTVIEFPQPLYGRYIRLYSTKLNADDNGNYYLQIAAIQAYSLPITVIASSFLSGWEPAHILDMDQNTVYSSNPSGGANATEWVGINLGSAQQISGINLTPRSSGFCFPVNFSLQSSLDGSTWNTIPGQSYTSYPNPGSNVQAFPFSSPINAQYIRVYATQLGVDDNGNHYFQMAQMSIHQALPFTATASSQITGLEASKVTDGNAGTFWSSTSHITANATEWLQLDMGSTNRIQDIRMVPRQEYAFPQALSIQYSTDGSNWSQIPGQSYTAFVDPAADGTTPNMTQLFYFSTPVTARYLKITATRLRTDNFGGYYFQLADVFIDQ